MKSNTHVGRCVTSKSTRYAFRDDRRSAVVRKRDRRPRKISIRGESRTVSYKTLGGTVTLTSDGATVNASSDTAAAKTRTAADIAFVVYGWTTVSSSRSRTAATHRARAGLETRGGEQWPIGLGRACGGDKTSALVLISLGNDYGSRGGRQR